MPAHSMGLPSKNTVSTHHEGSAKARTNANVPRVPTPHFERFKACGPMEDTTGRLHDTARNKQPSTIARAHTKVMWYQQRGLRAYKRRQQGCMKVVDRDTSQIQAGNFIAFQGLDGQHGKFLQSGVYLRRRRAVRRLSFARQKQNTHDEQQSQYLQGLKQHGFTRFTNGALVHRQRRQRGVANQDCP